MDIILNLVILNLIFVGLAHPAQAYLDPGSGSFLFQIIVGAVLSATFAIKLYFRKIKSWFKRSPKPTPHDEQK